MSKKALGISFCLVLLGIFTAAAAVYVESDGLISSAVQVHHRLACEAATHAVDAMLTRTRQLISFAASMPAVADAARGHNREQAQKLLHNLAEQNREEELKPLLSLLDNKGSVLASSVFTASQADSAFFHDAVQGRFAFQEPENIKELNEAFLVFAEPVMQGKQVVGVLSAHLDLQQLSINALPILHDVGVENAFVYALDSTGRILMHTDFNLVGISMRDEPWAREMLHRKLGLISYDWLGTPRVAAFAPLPKLGWIIAVSLREEDVLAPQRAVRNCFLGGSLAVATLVLLTLYLLLRKSRFHLRVGSELALAALGSELKLPSGETPTNEATLLHCGLSIALEKARQHAMLLEHALSNQYERLHCALASMMEGALHVDADGAVRFANPVALDMLRCQEKDVIDRQMQAVLLTPVGFSADNNELSDVMQAVGASHPQTFAGKILRCRDESLLVADIVVQPLLNDGKENGAVLAIRDVSLIDAQQQILSAITRVTGGMYLLWNAQCRLVDCGSNYTSFFLAPSKDELLKNFMRFMPERQANGRVSASELERHQLTALNTGGDNCDWLFKNELGETIPCDLTFRRLSIRGQSAVLGFARNIRSALAAEERLASGHANLQQILNALPVAVGIVGKGTLLYANHELEEFFALHGNEPALSPFSPMQDASFGPEQNFLQKINNRHLQLFALDGSMHDYMLSCFPTEFDGAVALMGWIVDVTKLKEEEQRLIQTRDQALETIEVNKRFLNQLERDIRDPLNGILFSLQHAVQARGAEQNQAVNAAYTFGRHMQDTLSHMLNMSGVTPPPLVHEITRFKAADFFHDALDDFSGAAEAKGITFDFWLEPALPEYLVGDCTLLRLIINHLVDNAVKYTVVGGVTVDVTPLPSGKENNVVLHIIVSDTGLGISDVQLGALFRSFSDGAQNPKLLSENTSFGLAMVRSYVNILEGELCAISEPEQGTEMHLVLPFALKLPEEDLFFEEAEEETLPFLQASLEPAPTQNREPARTKKRILVVDDIPTNMQIMVLILQKMGYEAIGADSGANALDLLEKQSFDLIFMDIQMPQMNGIETTAHIRNNSTGRYPRNIPIVAMTAHAMLGDPEKYMAAGMNDYLSKPVIIEDIANILNNLLKD